MPNNIDIVNDKNQPTGKQTSIDDALKHSLWHRGVHIIVYTKTGYVLVQKRSSKMVVHPGYLDLSCGGFVDAGETPEEAALRELREELNLRLSHEDLQLITVRRKRQTLRRLHKRSRSFVYCYSVVLPSHTIDLSHLQIEEVKWAAFIKLNRARRLVRLHYLKGFGRIEPLYGLYAFLLRSAAQTIRDGQ